MIIEVRFIQEPGDGEDGIQISGKLIRIDGVDPEQDEEFFISTSNFIRDTEEGKKELTGKGSIRIMAKGNIPEWKEA